MDTINCIKELWGIRKYMSLTINKGNKDWILNVVICVPFGKGDQL